jgi:hypothetical protein
MHIKISTKKEIYFSWNVFYCISGLRRLPYTIAIEFCWMLRCLN